MVELGLGKIVVLHFVADRLHGFDHFNDGGGKDGSFQFKRYAREDLRRFILGGMAILGHDKQVNIHEKSRPESHDSKQPDKAGAAWC